MWHSRSKHLCIIFLIKIILHFANGANVFLINCIITTKVEAILVDSLVEDILILYFIIHKSNSMARPYKVFLIQVITNYSKHYTLKLLCCVTIDGQQLMKCANLDLQT